MTAADARPLFDLEPVALPPPGKGGIEAPSLSLRAALSVALLVGVFVVALALIAAGVALNIGLFRLGRVNVALIIGTVAIIAALGRALLAAVKAPPEPLDEVDTLTVSQLRAVLAHELGHLAGGDTRLGPLAYRTEELLANLVGRLGGSVSGWVFHAYWKLQHRLSSKVRRGQELVADRPGGPQPRLPRPAARHRSPPGGPQGGVAPGAAQPVR